MKVIIVDIDGTIADTTHRDYLSKEKKWEEYFERCFHDKPYEKIIDLVKLLKTKHDILFCTGRSEVVRERTQIWLDKHGLGGILMLMRPKDNHLPDYAMKPKLIKSIGLTKEDVEFVLEDRNIMVKKWRDMGYVCLQVKNGRY